jgi:hypothetical protein
MIGGIKKPFLELIQTNMLSKQSSEYWRHRIVDVLDAGPHSGTDGVTSDLRPLGISRSKYDPVLLLLIVFYLS